MRALEYAAFLDRKTHIAAGSGMDPAGDLPAGLFDFQRALVTFALRRERAALLADCGLGKGYMLLAWADVLVRRTNARVLVLEPLAVAYQLAREAEKFGIPVHLSRDGDYPGRGARGRGGIVVTNYAQLHRFDPSDFTGVVCDESSILKNFDGTMRAAVTAFMRKVRFRLLLTATAAPNDYIELGTQSEALGELGYMDMLARFFKNDQNNCATGRMYATQGGGAANWRFKGHAEVPFWRWVASWARAMRRPSDLGFDDARFALPPLVETEHLVEPDAPPPGRLFDLPAQTLSEQREERRRTLRQRCEAAAARVADTGAPFVVWCDTNDESALLAELLPDALEVRGTGMSDEEKETRLLAFAAGETRGLVTKQSIAGFGLNWQHCGHMAAFPSHSYERYYQAVRRFWRFGRVGEVRVDLICTPGSQGVLANLRRKAVQADRMFDALVAHMRDATHIARERAPATPVEVPAWLRAAA